MPDSFVGFLGHRPYVVRLLGRNNGSGAAAGEWLIEMPGIPPILFPATSDDDDAAVRRKAEHLLGLVMPEE